MKKFMEQRLPRERIMIVVAVIVVLAGGIFSILPAKQSGQTLLSADQARLKYEALVKEKNQLESVTATLKPRIEAAVFHEPADNLVPEMIRSLQTCAKQAGVHLREIKPQRPRKINALTMLPMSVRFTSDFTRTIPFLYQVEDPKNRLNVQKFSVTAGDAKTTLVDTEVQVALYTTK